MRHFLVHVSSHGSPPYAVPARDPRSLTEIRAALIKALVTVGKRQQQFERAANHANMLSGRLHKRVEDGYEDVVLADVPVPPLDEPGESDFLTFGGDREGRGAAVFVASTILAVSEVEP